MLSFQALNLRSARLEPPYDKFSPKAEAEGGEVEDVGPRVRRLFGQHVLWCRFENEGTDPDKEDSSKSTHEYVTQQNNSRFVGRHLTSDELEPYRLVGDPIVDDLLQALHDEGSPVGAGDDLLNFCQQASAKLATTLGSNTSTRRAHVLAATFWNKYSCNGAKLPSWVDVDQLQRGQQVFLAYTPAMSYALYYRSFVPGFSIPKIAQVLKTTGYLTPTPPKKNSVSSFIHSNKRERVRERLMDTGAFIAACMGLDVSELLPGGQGWRTALQVRILHAKVRHALSKRRDWKVNEWGVPINAEDMAATLLAFSTNSLLGVEFLLGFPLSRQEREDYLALWRYVGWLLGVNVNDDANPSSAAVATMASTTTTAVVIKDSEKESSSNGSNNLKAKTEILEATTLRPLDPCGPGWIENHPNVIEHSNAMLQSIIFHILRPNELSVTIANHLLRMRQPQRQSSQHLNGNGLPHTVRNADGGNDTVYKQPKGEEKDNLWFFFRALQCRRFVGDPLADALQLPLHTNWWTRQWLFAASTTALLLVRWYTRLALRWSPLRRYMIQYHQRGMQSFWNSWQEVHPQRMTQALATQKGMGDGESKSRDHSRTGKAQDTKNGTDCQTDGPACPFAMVAPPMF